LVSAEQSREVAAGEAGERLDRWLVLHFGGVGRRGASELIARGLVRVNGRVAVKSRRLQPGDVVSIANDPSAGVPPDPELALDVRLERADLVVVNKPAGQATAPLHADERGSLAGALVARYPEMAAIGYRPREPGLVHRLDTETSGLVIAARERACFEHLVRALKAERLHKEYLAIVEDQALPERGTIELALTMAAKGSGRVVVDPSGNTDGVRRRSEFRTLERRAGLALVSVTVGRAYRHQVRVHLAASGFPIVGDKLYGGRPAPELGGRHALHASHVAWAGDAQVAAFAVESELPADLATLFRGSGSVAETSGKS
jgi:23S rRNA pseudouridine1911/1915/1917 synthase